VQVVVLNGVNLNMLGRRNLAQYGTATLSQLETRIYGWAAELGMGVRCFQTNAEGEYVGMIHDACDWAAGLVVNPGAWTHYSYAVRDALEIFPNPIWEVHLSDVEAREEWRRRSVIADVVTGRISGRGAEGYREALLRLRDAAR
jgi:3-dehydroquinate dehydratase-2